MIKVQINIGKDNAAELKVESSGSNRIRVIEFIALVGSLYNSLGFDNFDKVFLKDSFENHFDEMIKFVQAATISVEEKSKATDEQLDKQLGELKEMLKELEKDDDNESKHKQD